jgi:hypothetical protein
MIRCRLFQQRSAIQQRVQIGHPGARKRIRFGIILTQPDSIKKNKQDFHSRGLYNFMSLRAAAFDLWRRSNLPASQGIASSRSSR